MDAFLKPSKIKAADHNDFIKPSRTSAADQLDISVAKTNLSPELPVDQDLNITSPDDVYKALDSQPNIEMLLKVLKWLQVTENEFRWKVPSPKTARITNLLVNKALPDHWLYMQSEDASIYKKARKLMLGYLASLTGISTLVTRLQSLMTRRKSEQQQRDAKVKAKVPAAEEVKALEDVIDVLQRILAKEDMLSKLWNEFEAADIKPLQRGLLQKELVNLLAGSRVLSFSAEAFATIDELNPEVGSRGWIGNGQQYALWLAKSIKTLALNRGENSHEKLRPISANFSRAMSLGYPDQIIKGVFWDMANISAERLSFLQAFLGTMHFEMQRTVLYSLIRILSEESAIRGHTEHTPGLGTQAISAIAAFLSAFIQGKDHLQSFLADWVTDRSGGGGGEVDNYSRRAVILVLSQHRGRSLSLCSTISLTFLESIQDLVQTLFTLFGDSLYIKHTPIFNQEGEYSSLLVTAWD